MRLTECLHGVSVPGACCLVPGGRGAAIAVGFGAAATAGVAARDGAAAPPLPGGGKGRQHAALFSRFCSLF